MRGVFVTGTGTGVGKTHVAAALARRARLSGSRVFAFKPIETGCTRSGGVLVGADQSVLVEATGGWQTGDLAGVYQFEPPVAPSVAGGTIDLAKIHRVFEAGARRADFSVVEGAGGWRVPITATADMSTLARQCGLPVVVVATATLGTINHSLLTVEAIVRDGLQVAGLVLSKRPEDDLSQAESNKAEIQSRWAGRVIVLNHPEDLDVFHVKQ